jgi:hypothetical protein
MVTTVHMRILGVSSMPTISAADSCEYVDLFGEPLAVTPRDAVRSYYCPGTDAMIIGSFLLTKR